MEHSDLANGKSTRMRPLLPIAILLLGIIVMSVHGAGGFVLLKIGLGGLSLSGPLAYVLIGLFLVLAVLKLKHVVGFMHWKEKREDAGKARKG